jgi:hypothetical protein
MARTSGSWGLCTAIERYRDPAHLPLIVDLAWGIPGQPWSLFMAKFSMESSDVSQHLASSKGLLFLILGFGSRAVGMSEKANLRVIQAQN